MIESLPTSQGLDVLSELMKAVRGLQRITITQNPSEHTPFDEAETICPKLVRSTEALSKSSTTTHIELDQGLVIEKWKQFQSDTVNSALSGRDCKRFCWVPEIVSDNHFRNLVIEQQIPITLPSLRGLLYSYHERFTSLSTDEKFNSKLRQIIASRSAANSTVKKWHESIDCLIGHKAPQMLAKLSSKTWILPEKQLDELGLNPTTNFAHRFASELASLAAETFDSISKDKVHNIIHGIFCSQLVLVDHKEYKASLSTIILSNRANSDEEIQSLLIDFFLKNKDLGDPRINPENWTGIREDAKGRVIQWLSREDINFFFELLLRDRDDKHGRKRFWLQYVDKVSRSRALISRDDLRQHSVRLREMEEKGRSYGELAGSNTSSAFVLDFGRIVVVEFSEIGNACYIYEKEAFSELYKNFWAKEFPSKLLKNQDLVAERITRSMKDWQSSARQILSRFGVRRG